MARLKIGNVFPPLAYLLKHCAPAGYGLGAHGAETTDLNTAVKSGWYSFTNNCNNRPVDYGVALVLNRYDSEVVQIAFDAIGSAGWHQNGLVAMRFQNDGVWGEWEYANPQMEYGTEYRTTERWQRNAVYYKLVSFGNLPNATTKSVPIGAGEIDWAFIDLSKSWVGNSSDNSTNRATCLSKVTDITIEQGQISITTNADMTGSVAYIAVKYTKKTE
jgi:hypothetical protein